MYNISYQFKSTFKNSLININHTSMQLIINRIFLSLTFIFLSVGCKRYVYLSNGNIVDGISSGLTTAYYNDSLQIRICDFARMHFDLNKINEADRLILNNIRYNRNSTKILFTSYNQIKMLPSHRLIGLWRSIMPDNWKKNYQIHIRNSHNNYYFRQIPSTNGDIFDCIIPVESAYLELVWEIPYEDKPNHKVTQAYFFDEMNFVMGELRLGSNYRRFSPPNPFALINDSFGSIDTTAGNYLLPITMLKGTMSNYSSPMEKGIFLQAVSTVFSFVNEPDSVSYYWRKLGGKVAKTSPQKNLHVLPATEVLLTQSAAARIVMLNENHVQTKGRYWLSTLLPNLYHQGFRYLALEALGDDATLRQRGYPTLNSGFYLREPHLANLVREALSLGFEVIHYDAMLDNREQDQAKNLLRQTIEKDNKAKVIVLAGIGHINEDTTHSKFMAGWVKFLSGIDPLTVNETDLDELPIDTKQEGVFLPSGSSTSLPIKYSMKNDIYIINRINVYDKGNDFDNPSVEPINISIPVDSLPKNKQFILLVYYKNELNTVKNPVPIWIRLSKEPRQKVKLRSGEYIAIVESSGGTRLWASDLHVP